VLNAQARGKLARANAELAFLRPEYARLLGVAPGGGFWPSTTGMSPGWHPDPTGRRQYRLWDGYVWGDEVADDGIASTDRMVNLQCHSRITGPIATSGGPWGLDWPSLMSLGPARNALWLPTFTFERGAVLRRERKLCDEYCSLVWPC
jgi:hypothetical protein